ncbi:solute carrier family 25 member 47-A isoform X4 [Siphateles boraxobius]|uniref:solute carrier family 25 member 47-A isoform X4 n=1 Tax=Siphateles boraxobius TaxID=180520 RepID=UPI004062FE52
MHFADFLAGSVGGACGVAVGYPLDTVKVRIQTQKQFTGVWQCIVKTGKKEGVHGFFKGMSLPVSTISMTSSVVFGTYRNCLQCLAQLRGTGAHNSKLDVFLSGLAGGVAQISVMSPGDLVKVRLQCQTESRRRGVCAGKPRYSGPIHCLLSIAKHEGVSGLYRGALPLALRDGPSFATYFLTYNTLCSRLTPAGQEEPGFLSTEALTFIRSSIPPPSLVPLLRLRVHPRTRMKRTEQIWGKQIGRLGNLILKAVHVLSFPYIHFDV